jgi:hypothetical protein
MGPGRDGVSFTQVTPRGTPPGRAIETGVTGLGKINSRTLRIEIVACHLSLIDPSPERTCGTHSNLPRDAAFRQWRLWVVYVYLPLRGKIDLISTNLT